MMSIFATLQERAKSFDQLCERLKVFADWPDEVRELCVALFLQERNEMNMAANVEERSKPVLAEVMECVPSQETESVPEKDISTINGTQVTIEVKADDTGYLESPITAYHIEKELEKLGYYFKEGRDVRYILRIVNSGPAKAPRYRGGINELGLYMIEVHLPFLRPGMFDYYQSKSALTFKLWVVPMSAS
jgi:hypothetical protein